MLLKKYFDLTDWPFLEGSVITDMSLFMMLKISSIYSFTNLLNN